MFSKLAAALLAPLVISIVWPAPQPLARPVRALPTAALGTTAGAATPASAASGHARAQLVSSASPFGRSSRAAHLSDRAGPLLPSVSPRGRVIPSAPPLTARPSLTPGISQTSLSPKVALYNSLNQPGMFSTDGFTGQNAPPDSTGAIGPNHYVEMANSAIAVYSRASLNTKLAVQDFQTFAGASLPYCDPQVQWDSSANRFFYVFIACDPTIATQEFDFGWSKTSNPSDLNTGWCQYFFDLSAAQQLFDYPKLGHNANYMIVGTNVFDTSHGIPNPPSLGSGLLWIHKPANGSTTCPAGSKVSIGHSPLPLLSANATTGAFAATPVPVNTTTSSANGYVVSAFDVSAPSTKNKLGVWHVDSTGVLRYHPDITVDPFTLPAPAPQPGSPFTLDTLDGRLTQAVGDPTTGIWTQHTVDGPSGRSMVSWYEIKVSGSSASLFDSGNIASNTDFVFNGAISPRTDAGGAAIIYNRSSAATDPLIAAQIRFTATPSGNMEPGELVLASSPVSDHDFTCGNPGPTVPCRWGDYSGLSPDPVVSSVVWGTSEFIALDPPVGGVSGWSNENFALSFLTKPGAPTAVSASPGNAAAAVSWTPSTDIANPVVASYTITEYVGSTPTLTLVIAAPTTSARFGGLTNGVTYTFTVFATNSFGSSAESVHSNAVTPGSRETTQASPTTAPTRTPVQPAPAPTPTPR